MPAGEANSGGRGKHSASDEDKRQRGKVSYEDASGPAAATCLPSGEYVMVAAGGRVPPHIRGLAVKRLTAGARRFRDATRPDPRDRWAVVFGRIAVYSFAVAVVTGILLLPYFRPSMAAVAYRGSYRRLDGVVVSQAYRSVLAISLDV